MAAAVTNSIVRRLGVAVSALVLAVSLGVASVDERPAVSQPVPQVQPQASSPAIVAVPAYRKAENVVIIKVEGDIDAYTLYSIDRRLEEARTRGADAVVIEIDTLGGDAIAALDICNLLKDRSKTPANVVAWVHPKAYSAGTFMALACREIVVSPNASMGDAAPIAMSQLGFLLEMPPAERAKAEAPLLYEVIDSARRHHYDEKLVQAFVSVGVELWLIENVQTGQQVFVDAAEYRTLFEGEPPAQSVSLAVPTTLSPSRRIQPWISDIMQPPSNGSTSDVDPQAIAAQALYQQQLPSLRPTLTSAERGQWKLIGQVDAADRLLVVKAPEALYFGLAQAVVSNDGDLAAYFGADSANVTRLNASWSEGLVRFLVSFPVRALLIAIFLICLFVEMATPGMGIFGAVAALALLVLIGAHYLVGLAQWWDALLVILGLVFVAAELFVIPGTGIAGIMGIVMLLVGLVGTFVSGDLSSATTQNELQSGIFATLAGVLGGGVGIWLVSRHVRNLPFMKRLILSTELREDPVAGGLLAAMGATAPAIASGDIGMAATDLRPAGKANFNGRLLDVQSSTGFIERGSALRVISSSGLVIEVERAES